MSESDHEAYWAAWRAAPKVYVVERQMPGCPPVHQLTDAVYLDASRAVAHRDVLRSRGEDCGIAEWAIGMPDSGVEYGEADELGRHTCFSCAACEQDKRDARAVLDAAEVMHCECPDGDVPFRCMLCPRRLA